MTNTPFLPFVSYYVSLLINLKGRDTASRTEELHQSRHMSNERTTEAFNYGISRRPEQV
jgi:hypothetical protein